MKTQVFSFCFLWFFSGLSAFGAEATNKSESASKDFGGAEFSYAMLLKGASIQYLDGNSNGRGANLNLRHYQDFGLRFADKWKITAGTQFRQNFRPADPKKVDQTAIEWRDPSLGIARKDVWRSGPQAVSAKARYYLPVTDYNASNWDKEYDDGKGSVQVGAAYATRFADDLFAFRFPLDATYRFNKLPHEVRQDYWFGARPSLSCRTGQSTSLKVEYYTGDLNHKTDGTWTRFNDPVLGQTASLGFDWMPVKEWLVSPQVTWGRQNFRFNAAELSLYTSYVFL